MTSAVRSRSCAASWPATPRRSRTISNQGREKVAARTGEGLAFEKSFSEVSLLLLNHLKAKPEVRDLLQDLMSNMHGQGSGGARPMPQASRSPDSP